MKILWFTWKDRKNPLAGGAEVVNEELAKRLVVDGHEVIFLVGSFTGAAQEEQKDGYKIIRVGGVGFIGAGLIFTKDSKLVGLTTATGLWVAAGIGMASGLGFFKIAIIATVLTLFIFIVLWFIEEQLRETKFFKESNPENFK